MNEQLTMALLVAAGGALGALLRFGISLAIPSTGGIGWSTLVVNFIGCSLITLLMFSIDSISPEVRMFLFVGVFGAFTTMSSVSLETINLYASGMIGMALLNFILNMTVCLGGGFLGRAIALNLPI